ncbi:serine hydrolase [Streptomyces tubercidicus]|uniref:serine hydrolase n=1 Tax=Streptomyces tubercidicus TaxID=47759 RepID=UPI0036A6EEEF
MKETSVAGESPDKSDKKQSSGKTARKARDPRLSAFRGEPDESASEPANGSAEESTEKSANGSVKESANGSAKGAAKGSGAGKQSKPAEESKSEAKPGAESAAKPETGGEPESGADAESGAGSASESASEEPQGAEEDGAGAEGGDDRLRAAVAAWVATKDDEDAEAGEGDGDADADAGTSDASEGADGADGDADDDVAGAAATSEAKQEAKPDAKPDAKPGAKQQVKPEVKPEEKAGTAKAAEAETEAGAESASENESGSGSRSGSGDKPESGSKSESRAKVAVVDQPTSVFKTVGPQKGKPGGAADAAKASNGDGKGGDAAEVETEVEAEGSAVDEATRVFAFAKSKKLAEAEGVDHATTAFKITPPAKDGDAAKSKAKDKPEEKGKADGKGAGKAETDSKADAKTDGKAGSKTDGKKDANDANDTKDAKAPKAPKAAERDSERTSQFVALKSADDGTAGRSLGKTAPKTPARTPDKAADKPGDEDKASDKAGTKPAGKAPGALPAAEPAKSTGTGKSTGATKSAGTAKAAGPTAAPKPAAPKPADRTGATASATTGATPAPAALPDSEHTKQQPLPPLDLLAQLTNTPPPPETPLRSVVRRFKIWTPLAVLLVIIFVVAQAVRPLPDPTLTVGDAKSSYIFEGGKLDIPWPAEGQAAVKVVGSGDLGTFGPQKPVPTASVAKIMTAYVVLRDHPLKKGKAGPQIEVDAKAVTEGGSTDESRIEGLRAGQKFSQQDMLKMLMIPSGNNIARLLARWDTQSANEGAFVKKMNAAAKDLGMKNTTYTDPSGLDPKTVSTAVDQLKLAEAVMKFDAFRPIVAMPNAEIQGLPKRINNNNDDLLLAGLSIKGIKTGSSTAAGGTLSWAAYKTVDGKDQLILGTMMDQHFKGLDPNASNSLTMVKNNSKKVVEAVRNALTSATAVKKGQVVGYVDDGLNGRTPVVATKDLKAVGVPGQKLTLSVGDGGKTVPHTAKAGTEVGVLTVGNGQSKQQVPVALQQDLVEPSFGAKLVRIT